MLRRFLMKHDEEVRAGRNWRSCAVCGVDHLEGECPSCNPVNSYWVGIAVAEGEDDLQFEECGCGCTEFWNLKDAVAHASGIDKDRDCVVQVVDGNGREVWTNY
jgi:hypothetical protein